MFMPPLPPDLLVRTARPTYRGLAPRPARGIPRRGATAPAPTPAASTGPGPLADHLPPDPGTTPPVVVPSPMPPLRWRIWLGRRLIRIGQWLAGDRRPGGLRLVGGAD